MKPGKGCAPKPESINIFNAYGLSNANGVASKLRRKIPSKCNQKGRACSNALLISEKAEYFMWAIATCYDLLSYAAGLSTGFAGICFYSTAIAIFFFFFSTTPFRGMDFTGLPAVFTTGFDPFTGSISAANRLKAL